MCPEKIRRDVNRIHENFSATVVEILKAAEEIKELTEDGTNPIMFDLLAPRYLIIDEVGEHETFCDDDLFTGAGNYKTMEVI